jgi:hypothetical protein
MAEPSADYMRGVRPYVEAGWYLKICDLVAIVVGGVRVAEVAAI